ncbi:MAG: BamA/TamA family outer membrane protein [Myxococcales bacterium]|nr:BamA/TamA family outer membrane protein [Myxococcales bacterium]
MPAPTRPRSPRSRRRRVPWASIAPVATLALALSVTAPAAAAPATSRAAETPEEPLPSTAPPSAAPVLRPTSPSAPPSGPAEEATPEGPAEAEEDGKKGKRSKRGKKGEKEGDAPAKEKKPERLEFGGLPATNYDSDLGVGFGAIATLAKFHPGYRPYRWRVQMLLYATAKRGPKGVELPYHEDYINVDVPGLLDNRLRINGNIGFKKFSTTGYYGIGNGSLSLKPWEMIDKEADPEAFAIARRYNQYDRIFPGFDVNARIRAWDRSIEAHRRRLEVFVGTYFSYNVIRPYESSKLTEDIEAAKADTPDGHALDHLLNGTGNHAMWRINLGLVWDTRDHEFVPTRGTFTEVSTRVSPGVDDKLYHAGFTVNTSWYKSLVGSYLVFATRAVGDVLVGNVPFWELTRFGALLSRDGPGGSWSVRGVPRQRFSGKAKFVSNVELRSEFLPFRIKGQRFMLGAIAFVDTGRVWADIKPTIINGQNVDRGGLAVGVGGGLRVRWGETFLVRVDPSYSITEDNFGIYIDIGHIF